MRDNINKHEDKQSKNSASYLIWNIFTRERQLHKARSLDKRIHTSDGNMGITEFGHSKSASPGKTPGYASNHKSAAVIASLLSHTSLHCSEERIDQNSVYSQPSNGTLLTFE